MQVRTAFVSLATPNLPQSRQFYESLLGVSPAIAWLDKYVEFRLSGLRLGLYESVQPDFQARLGAMSLCLQVDDLDRVLRSPALTTVNMSAVREAAHGREVDFCDPDGNRVVVHQPSAEFFEVLKLDTLPPSD